MQQIIPSPAGTINGTKGAGLLDFVQVKAWDLFWCGLTWQSVGLAGAKAAAARLLQYGLRSAWDLFSSRLTWQRVAWAGAKATAADLRTEVDVKDFLNWGTSGNERYLEGVHYEINAFLGQPSANFYTFMSVAQDATTEEIWKAYMRMSADAALDLNAQGAVNAQGADVMTETDLLAIVVDTLVDNMKRGQYNKVLERINLRAAAKPNWFFSFLKNMVFG